MRAVVLAGGKGTRMAPYTTVLPKPLMPIGDMPILEVVLRQLKAAGIDQVTMSVGHLAHLLRAFFDDGGRLGLRIDYAVEREPLGTVGPLALVDGLDQTFLLMNGDVLTDLDYRKLIDAHRARQAVATIATYVRDVRIDFGVLRTDADGRLTEYTEKPTLQYRVSMGIYVLEPAILRHVKKGLRLDFPDLIKTLIQNGENVVSYPFRGYWLDMGRPDDYERAVLEFEARKTDFLPEEAL
jgi:NDP-mannose synthase